MEDEEEEEEEEEEAIVRNTQLMKNLSIGRLVNSSKTIFRMKKPP